MPVIIWISIKTLFLWIDVHLADQSRVHQGMQGVVDSRAGKGRVLRQQRMVYFIYGRMNGWSKRYSYTAIRCCVARIPCSCSVSAILRGSIQLLLCNLSNFVLITIKSIATSLPFVNSFFGKIFQIFWPVYLFSYFCIKT